MAVDDSFDKGFFNKYLWKKLNYIRSEKSITYENLSGIVWVSQSYLTNMFNGRQVASNERWKSIAKALWISSSEFEKIFNDAREAEYEHTTWQSISNSEEIEFDFALKQEFPNEEAYREAKNLLDMVTLKYKDR